MGMKTATAIDVQRYGTIHDSVSGRQLFTVTVEYGGKLYFATLATFPGGQKVVCKIHGSGALRATCTTWPIGRAISAAAEDAVQA